MHSVDHVRSWHEADMLRRRSWIWNLAPPASAAFSARLVWWSSVGYLGLALATTAVLWSLSDRWWLATVLLFGPRWMLLLPLIVLIPATLLRRRRLLVVLGLATAIVIGPLMGFQLNWLRVLESPDPDQDIRVVSLNAQGGRQLTASIPELLTTWDADIAAFQECGGSMGRTVRNLEHWYTDARNGLCVISRFPIVDVKLMDRTEMRSIGGTGMVQTYVIDVRGDLVHLTNVHLASPRAGLVQVGQGRLAAGSSTLQASSRVRSTEFRRVRRWVAVFGGPKLLVGDFNTPVESRAYRADWSDWQNGFSNAGWGFGTTRLAAWLPVRIDHIVVDGSWKVVRATVGDDVGSDHLPVIADIRLRGPR